MTADVASRVTDMVLDGNDLRRNGDAIYVDSVAHVHANTAIANTGWGIWTPLATDLGGNVAYRNGTEPQCVGVVCSGR